MRIAVCPGSFDPITVGHVAIVERAALLFDRVVVAVAVNAAKTPLLDVETRVALASDALRRLQGVEVRQVEGLIAEFAKRSGAAAIVKGLRSGLDFDAEAPQAGMNEALAGIPTVFLPADPATAHIASSLVKDIARHGGDVNPFVPAGVAAALARALS